jgi:hypothetical protein
VHGNIGGTPLVEQLLRAERLDTIGHFAAQSHVDRSIEAPDAALFRANSSVLLSADNAMLGPNEFLEKGSCYRGALVSSVDAGRDSVRCRRRSRLRFFAPQRGCALKINHGVERRRFPMVALLPDVS